MIRGAAAVVVASEVVVIAGREIAKAPERIGTYQSLARPVGGFWFRLAPGIS